MYTVMIIEDTGSIREEMCEILRMEGYKVIEAEDAKNAIKILETVLPSLIISDLLMPEIDGIELLTMIKDNFKLKNIPFILLTAKADPGTVEFALESGVSDFLVKPVDVDVLIETVKKWIR